MSPLVPAEISDYIIDFLYDDIKSLRACNLTCHTFHPAARYHLFQSLEFTSLKSSQSFYSLLQHSPHLGRYARDASFAKITYPTQVGHADGGGSLDTDQLWSSIFPALPSVQRLEFLFLEQMDSALRRRIADNFHSVTRLTLQYCRFATFGEFVALYQSFPKLEHLTLRSVSWQDVETMLPGTPVTAPSLTSLNLAGGLDLVTLADWFLAEDVRVNMTSLSLSSTSLRDTVILGDIVRAMGPSLDDLTLDWYGDSFNDVALPAEFTLAECTHLKSLKLCFPIRPNGTLSWVPTAISQLQSSYLENLSFDIRLLGDIDTLDWCELDRTLSKESFKRLSSVSIKIKAWSTAIQREAEACSVLLEQLPTLASKGIVSLATP